MNIRNMTAALAALAAAFAAFGDPDAPKAAEKTPAAAVGDAAAVPTAEARPKKKISPEKLRETIRKVQTRKTGGMVRKAGSAKGEFVVLNAQRTVPAEAVAPVVGALDKSIRVQSKVVSAEGVTAGNAKAEIAKAGGVLGVALVEGGGPSLLVAPEDGWAVVDVASLAKDCPDAATLAARVRKETLRAFAFVAGGAYLARGEPLMRDVRKPKDLDAADFENFGIEEIVHLRESVMSYGLVPWKQATYRVACQEGWAPQPTNEFQQAIWNEIRQLPSNPIKIEFDPKSGK